jgi:hypothetical protein
MNLSVSQLQLTENQLALTDSDYELTPSLPDNLKGSLPSIEAIEAEFSSRLVD